MVIRTEPLESNNKKPLNNGHVALFHLKNYDEIKALDNYDADIIRYAENALNGFGLELKIVPFNNYEKQFEFIADYIANEKNLKGVLLFSLDSWENTRKTLIHCEKKHIKTVCLSEGYRTELLNIPSVAMD